PWQETPRIVRRWTSVLGGCARGFAQGNCGVDGCTPVRLRIDRKLPAHEFHALRHADQAKPMRIQRHSGVESRSRIAHGEVNCVKHVPQLHVEVPYAAML